MTITITHTCPKEKSQDKSKLPVTRLRAVLAIFILFFAVAAGAQSPIQFYQPSGWSDSVVVTTDPNSTTDTSPLYTTNEIYVDWAILNNDAAIVTFDVDLYTNSVYVTTLNVSGLPSGYYTYVAQPAFDVGQFPAGVTQLKLLLIPRTCTTIRPPAIQKHLQFTRRLYQASRLRL